MTPDLVPLIQRFGYLATFGVSIFEGETALILSGLSAHRGYLQLPWCILAGALGGSVGDFIGFAVGRKHGAALLARFPAIAKGSNRVRAAIRAHPDAAVLAVRFMYGFRLVGPLVIGESGISWARFATFNLLGALAWSACWTIAGFALGEAAQRLLGDFGRYERELFFGVALAAAVVALVVFVVRRRAGSA
jgi:membrane protein DedA with SNARE-associated domain